MKWVVNIDDHYRKSNNNEKDHLVGRQNILLILCYHEVEAKQLLVPKLTANQEEEVP